MKALLPAILLVLGMPNAQAQSMRSLLSLPYTNFTAYSTHQKDALSFTANQAALAGIQQMGIGIYGEQRFLLAVTRACAAAVAIPTAKGILVFS